MDCCSVSRVVVNNTVDTAKNNLEGYKSQEGNAYLVDLRPKRAFYDRHIARSTSLPWEEFQGRAHELPPKQVAISLLIPENNVEEVKTDFRSRDYPLEYIFVDNETFWETATRLELINYQSHDSRILWQPSPCLGGVIETVEKIRREAGLPPAGIAVDLACGSARDGIFLSLRGWKSINFDYSAQNLQKASEMAKIYQVTPLVELVNLDVEKNSASVLEKTGGPVDLVNVARYLHRPLFDTIKTLVAPGGFVVYHTFMESCDKPRRKQFKLEPGELARIFTSGENGERKDKWRLIEDKIEGISDGRELSWFLAQRLE